MFPLKLKLKLPPIAGSVISLVSRPSVHLRAASMLRRHPTTGFKVIDPSRKVEEECFDWYSPTRFYPIRLGEVLHSRYHVLSKLGYGSCSTAWLCRDLEERKYVAIKVCIANYHSIERERASYAHLRSLHLDKQLPRTIRSSIDEFDITLEHGSHHCFVFEPLSADIHSAKQLLVSKYDEYAFKRTVVHVLRTLDFLHTEAKMVHADIRPDNICFSVTDDACFQSIEQDELELAPSPRKIDGDRIIYVSSPSTLAAEHLGVPVLMDFGEARFGQDSYTDPIQPFMYQAPEVLFNIPWSYPADIWNAVIMFWHFFEGKKLLPAEDSQRDPNRWNLAAEMIALMGPPPVSFLDTMPPDSRERCFDEDGNWKHTQKLPIPTLTLEGAETALRDAGKDNTAFLNFVRRALVWEPSKRPTAAQLLEDPWLKDVGVSETTFFEP